MTNNIRSGQERRVINRRQDDSFFLSCPKYEKHDLTDDQIEKVALKAMRMMSDQKDIEFAKFVKKVGFSWGEKVIFILGLLILWLIAWATNNGFKL